jgi:hypothetical protein
MGGGECSMFMAPTCQLNNGVEVPMATKSPANRCANPSTRTSAAWIRHCVVAACPMVVVVMCESPVSPSLSATAQCDTIATATRMYTYHGDILQFRVPSGA